MTRSDTYRLRMKPNSNWMEYAACAGMDSRLFFPENAGERHDESLRAIIRSACGNCPVADACLQYGQQIQATCGIWGGKEFRRRKHTDTDDETL